YEYEEIVKKSVQEGMSYPKALNSAYQQAIQSSASDRPFADLTKPNNILGFHYLQAARNIQSSMKAATISRIIADYHDDAVKGNSIASATGIRKSFFESNSLDAVQG
ncbi:nucleotidyltransferase family protein, partial [Microvirga sp. 3-52]|nr:nucleotidyltransferase family protein [Microvirga sp. 3-52]